MADARPHRSARDLSAGISRADSHETACPSCRTRSGRTCCFPAVILLAIAACAAFFGPFGPGGQPDPTIIQTAPRPDFFFLWLYAVLSFLPPAAETPLLLTGPVIGIALLLLLPFFAGEGEKSWRRRPIAVLTVLLTAVTLGALNAVGPAYAMESGDGRVEQRSPIPSKYLQGHVAAGAAGRAGFSGEAVPQLPFARRPRRQARTGARHSCAPPYAGSTHPPGDPGRR